MPCGKLHHRTKLCSKHAHLPSHMALNFFKNPACMALPQITMHPIIFSFLSPSCFLLLWFRLITVRLHYVEVSAFFASKISSLYFVALVDELGEFLQQCKIFIGAKGTKIEIRTGSRRLNMFHNFRDTTCVFQPKLRGWHASCSTYQI